MDDYTSIICAVGSSIKDHDRFESKTRFLMLTNLLVWGSNIGRSAIEMNLREAKNKAQQYNDQIKIIDPRVIKESNNEIANLEESINSINIFDAEIRALEKYLGSLQGMNIKQLPINNA